MADRYWVGGSANWDGTALLKWSSTSGGVGGQSVPTAADDVYIDSGSGVVTVTATSTSVCRNLSFISGSGSFAGTFAGTSGITVAGSLTLSASMTRTYTGAITFTSTTAQTITPNGINLDSTLVFNGVGGSWQLADNLVAAVVIPSTKSLTLTNGSLDLNNKTLTTALFSSNNSNTRSIAFGTGKISLVGSGTVVADTTTQTGFSYTGTGLIESTYSGSTGTRLFNIGRTTGATESNVLSLSIIAGSDTVTLNNTQRLKNLTFSGFTGTLTNQSREIYGNLTLSSGMTISAGANITNFLATSGTQQITTNGVTIDNPLTFNGVGGTFAFQDALTQGSTRAFTITNGTVQLKAGATSTVGSFTTSGTNQKFLQSSTPGSQATLSQAGGTVNSIYLTIKDINATGGATWNAYTTNNNIDAGNNLGWDFSFQIGRCIYTRRKNKRILP